MTTEEFEKLVDAHRDAVERYCYFESDDIHQLNMLEFAIDNARQKVLAAFSERQPPE